MNIPTQEIPKIEEKKHCLPCCPCSGWKIVVCVTVGLMVVAGAVFAGVQIGKKQIVPPELIPIDNGSVDIEVSPIPTSDPTANWKTYKSEKLGFEIKYPNNLEAVDRSEEYERYFKESDEECREDPDLGCGGGPRPGWVVDFFSPEDQKKMLSENLSIPNVVYQFRVSVYQKITLEDLFGLNPPANSPPYPTSHEIESYSFGGKIGQRNIQPSGYLSYGVEQQEKVYDLTFSNRTKSKTDLEYTEKILSTFKFLE